MWSQPPLLKRKRRKWIRDLQEQTRNQLHYTKAKWSSTINLYLYPYDLEYTNHIYNFLPEKEDGKSLNELFTGSPVSFKFRKNHSFFCLVYNLQYHLKATRRIPKWNMKARMGLYLRPSRRHTISVSIVINPETAIVPPQFHVQQDNFFEMVRSAEINTPTLYHWQY